MSKEKSIDFDNLIKLSGFAIDENEEQVLKKELEDFLDYSEIIRNFTTGDSNMGELKPASHAVEKEASTRQDVMTAWDNLEALLVNAPLCEDTSYIVPPQKTRSAEEKETQDQVNGGAVDNHEYEAVIGLEIHAHLKTRSKLFCSCSAEFGSHPNHHTCPVCTGQPGVLPVLNAEAVRMAVKAGLAAHCIINKHSIFARKNYFYPDLPKGYQISQFEEPVCTNGYVEIEAGNGIKKIRLNRIHIEEDAGKLVHIGAPGIWGSKATAVDYNRSSVPLIEIVTEPDMNSAREARDFVTMLRAILVSLKICDGNMEEGSLRCDANISIRKCGDTRLGVKTEIKNMNSFKAIERAIDFEIARQKKLKKSGMEIVQETRLWEESSQKTITMRSKEESHDYRYFPDPDLLPLVLSADLIASCAKEMPALPLERKQKYLAQYSLSGDEALLLMTNPDYAEYFELILEHYRNPRTLANWFFNELLSYLPGSIKELPITPGDLGQFLMRIDNGEISGKIGKEVIKKAFALKKSLNAIIGEEGLKQITDHKTIEVLVDKILACHPAEVAQYKSGKTSVLSFFVGKVMKESGGKANPALVNEKLNEKLKAQLDTE